MKSRMCTPITLQEELAEEIRKITADMRFWSPKGDSRVGLTVYKQALPIARQSEQEREASFRTDTIDYVEDWEEAPVFNCPWCVVKIDSGKIAEVDGAQEVELGICFGIYNPEENNQGHLEVMNLIQRVYKRFAMDPLLAGQYTCRGDFEWGMQEEDTHPYFFGAIGTSFWFKGYRREDIYGLA